MDAFELGLKWAEDDSDGNEYMMVSVINYLKSMGYSVVKFYTRADLDEDQELSDNLSLIPEDGLFIKESL